jgi:hypothetical protein
VIAYLLGRPHRDSVLEAFAKGCGAEFAKSEDGLKDGPAVIMGFDQNADNLVMQCMKEGREFYHIDHAYFDRGYEGGNFRVVKNGIHQNRLKVAPPSSRKIKDWQDGEIVIIIPPPPKIAKVFGLKDWVDETVATVRKHTDRQIMVKQKQTFLPLEFWLEKAHCLVSFASVADVEAVMNGVPVFVSKHSPAASVGEFDFSKIEEPIKPNRQLWLDTLSYSQFHISQMSSGEAWRALNAV